MAMDKSRIPEDIRPEDEVILQGQRAPAPSDSALRWEDLRRMPWSDFQRGLCFDGRERDYAQLRVVPAGGG